MKDDIRDYKTYSIKYGELIEATAQVYCEFEPADATTSEALNFLAVELGVITDKTTPKSRDKVIYALSDFWMAVNYSKGGLIFWPSANAEFTDYPYGGDIARRVKAALAPRYFKLAQKSSSRDGLCAVYSASVPDFGHALNFKGHGLRPLVQVRSEKVKRNGKQTGGKKLALKNFDQDVVATYRSDLLEITTCMKAHPLTAQDGRTFTSITRIFNNRSLVKGGRCYGSFQQFNEAERLTMTIDGCDVCGECLQIVLLVDQASIALNVAKASPLRRAIIHRA